MNLYKAFNRARFSTDGYAAQRKRVERRMEQAYNAMLATAGRPQHEAHFAKERFLDALAEAEEWSVFP